MMRAAALARATPCALRRSFAPATLHSARALLTRAPLESDKVSAPVFAPEDTFMKRHVGYDVATPQEQEMLKTVGVSSIDELMSQAMPAHIRRKDKLKMHQKTQSEVATLQVLKDILAKNVVNDNFIGQGYHGSHLPFVIQRLILENPNWYTAYTPYQAEISQGRMEVLVAFQTIVAELTGMEVANASLLDEATAAAEAMSLMARCSNVEKKGVLFLAQTLHPQTIAVVKTRAEYAGIKCLVGDPQEFDFSKKNLLGAILQYPDTRGHVASFKAVADALHAHGGMLCVSADPLALTLLTPPGELGADIAVGTTQRFGVPMFNGGPAAAYFACAKKHTRRMPGRLIGISRDAHGDPAFRLTLQTREQHIRLDKATSNICTSQVLLANIAAMYAAYHGPAGLQRIATRVKSLATRFGQGLAAMGVAVESDLARGAFFDTITFSTDTLSAQEVRECLAAKGMNVRELDSTHCSVAFDETHTEASVAKLLAEIAVVFNAKAAPAASGEVALAFPDGLRRSSKFMQQPLFNSLHQETEMMRYLTTLEKKDLSLTTSMITLGSCTMKLNSVASLLPVIWDENARIHPMAPQAQMQGYRAMLHTLEQWLCSVTGFAACSLQPMSGASGEYAGLLAIKKYLESQGEGHRNVCIIPKSAHGTNPASAAMMGMKVVWVDDSNGMSMEQLQAVCDEYSADLAALMITYPSTHGKFETNVIEIIDLIHQHGGRVYMDGANVNAHMGLTSPGTLKADVCHLNLHKTFSIPHGGGGPGLGPICCNEALAPFLPGHSEVHTGGSAGPVSGAPFGQAGIAVIPWMFIAMLGAEGLTRSSQCAILSANYMMTRLAGSYKMLSKNENGRCSHEFIMDLSEIRRQTGVTEEDIAKRLIDYGFHAPTMSWPVAHSLMVEPTESESKEELDRFCDAMIAIKAECDKIASGEWPADDNPLKNAPHTMYHVSAEEWTHPYSRHVAAFPAPWVRQRGKFWPTVGRVDNVYGDRVLNMRFANEK